MLTWVITQEKKMNKPSATKLFKLELSNPYLASPESHTAREHILLLVWKDSCHLGII